jgi:pyruvate formate lyase activating enzyme
LNQKYWHEKIPNGSVNLHIFAEPIIILLKHVQIKMLKGLVYNIRSFSVHDGPGIRQTVFLKGCRLRCVWCHNPESQEWEPETITNQRKIGNRTFATIETVGQFMSVADVMKSIENDLLFFEESGGGVTFSGGEPLLQADFTAAVFQACKHIGVHTALDTCGYAEAGQLSWVMPFTDLFLYDLKLADDAEHKRFTGCSNGLILENLKTISQNAKSITIRIPLIPGITDTQHNLAGLRAIIGKTKGIQRIDLLPYHSTAKHKYERLGKAGLQLNDNFYKEEKLNSIAEGFKNLAEIVSIGA